MSSHLEQNWTIYLGDMISLSEKAQLLAQNLTPELAKEDEASTYATRYALAMLGYSAKQIPVEIRSSHPDIPWQTLMDTRDSLVHFYYEIEPELIFNMVDTEIPSLIPKLEAMQEKYS